MMYSKFCHALAHISLYRDSIGGFLLLEVLFCSRTLIYVSSVLRNYFYMFFFLR